ncbi:MAG: LysR family transcriptional regulator [Hydrogenophaga sp.]|uniref:LysR family transcriptional regulator n=1 Tax=Hydrogenophaga sp. TaxID=1904254 RepID=UPI0027197416|nr:LysR family transcriptional regulator [Hydrogenophaga sp.]MDO9031927.1 LysR family transcriptional regulator [Hydrogenophaga sp.]
MKPEIDLNLLRVLCTVHSTRSASKAAEALGITQSGVSNALRRLRASFSDPLFVRCADGMQATARAQELIDLIAPGMADIESALASGMAFEPEQSSRLFRIMASDLAQMVLMPRLLAQLMPLAPNIRFETVDASPEDGRRGMEGGSIDLVFGNWSAFGLDFHRQVLFSEVFVVLMRADHPLSKRRLTRSAYLKARHLDYRPGGVSYQSLRQVLDKVLQSQNQKRHVTFTAAHALGLASVLSESDLLLTLPSRLVDAITAGRKQLVVRPLPIDSPEMTITLQWHARVHRDPSVTWLRRSIAQLFSAPEKL